MRELSEIMDEIDETNKEFDNNKDPSKNQYYIDKLEALEKEEDEASKKWAEEVMKSHEEKERLFKEKDFKDSLFLAEFYADKISKGEIKSPVWTDDFAYGDWKNEIPKEWLDEAIKEGDEKKALKRFYDIMGDLEDLFNHLCYFQEDVSNRFPTQILYVRLPSDIVIKLTYVVGQGSDFSIDVSEDSYKPFIFEWEEAIKVSKMKMFEQAKWYFENALVDAIAELPIEMIKDDINQKIFFLLGTAATGRLGFVQRLNSANIKEILEKY